MRVVGIREFKDRLSEYVRMVRRGEEVLLTERGEVVAQLRGADKIQPREYSNEVVADLHRRGLLVQVGLNDPAAYPKLSRALHRRSALDLLNEDRGDR
ncbi:MAG: type II toxin-antitoxin system prevent-host-death family antitoxin [Acidobacteriota bacterium]